MMTSLSVPTREMVERAKAALFSPAADLSTPEGRSRDRYRRAFRTTLVSVLWKVVTVATSLISVPLTLHYLGLERYGLWMTISSLIACLGFTDFGINNSLMNGISKANGLSDPSLAQQYVSSAFYFLSAIAGVLGILFGLVYRWIPWQSLFHIKSPQAVAEAGPAVAAFVTCYLVAVPVGIVTKIQSGYQEGVSANLWSLSGSLLGFLALLAVIRLHGSLPCLVVAVSGTPLIALLINTFVLFRRRPWIRPMWSQVRSSISRELLRTGFLFFILQAAAAISFSADNVVIAQVMGAEAVAEYAVPAKLFSLITLLSSFVVGPLWPAYAEALARKDYSWVTVTLRRSVYFLVGAALVGSGILIGTSSRLIYLWVGQTIHPSVLLLVGLGIWTVVYALSVPVAMFMNAATVIAFQVIVASAAAAGNIVLSVYLTRRLGVSGVIFGSILSHVVLVLVPYWLYATKLIGKLGEPQERPTFALG